MKSQGNDATDEAAPVHILTLSCEDRPGIVAAVTAELAANGANIAESSQFWDRQTNRFFMRIAFISPPGSTRD
ncbi:ACT domain-containing protein, partial [Mesorhizobium sp. M7A.F.Ca.CA.004.06.1.1]